MIYNDSIYGSVEIDEPVLLALLKTAAFQRIKGVLQHGITGLIGITDQTTRFDHSMGAMILVKRAGASVEEQAAALLHDVSHTAFSHVIDYVFDSHDSQSYHDEKKEEFVSTTDIPAVLTWFGYDWRNVLNEEAFSLLEQPSPRLCADRLDYFLRDAMPLGLANAADIERVLADLLVINGRFCLQSLPIAQWLGYTFMKADDTSWANFDEVGLYELTARAIKTGFRVGAITQDDIWGTDEPLWAKLHAHADLELQAQLALVVPETRFVWDEENPTFWVSTKLRAIDPDVVVDGELRPLSTIDPEFAHHRQEYLTRKTGKWPMRVVPHYSNAVSVAHTGK